MTMATVVKARSLSDEAMLGLFFIHRYRFLSIEQFAKISGLSASWSSELLLDLDRQKIVGHFGNVGIRGHGKTPKVYYLKRRGYEIIRRDSHIPDELLGGFRQTHITSKWSPVMYHRLATIDLLLALELGVRERPHLDLVETFIEYRRRRGRGGVVRETTDFVAPEEIPANRIIPDAAFVLENVETGRRALFFVEMDMGTERITAMISRNRQFSLHHRMQQYDRYLVGGRFAQTYQPCGEFRFFTLLFVTVSADRMNTIRREMGNLPAELHRYYRFNLFDRVKEDFFNEEWKARSPTDDAGHAIVR
jgi:hypothetical protein